MNDVVTRQGSYGPARGADEKFCFSCGTVLHASASDCTKCGAAQTSAPGVWVSGAPGAAQVHIPAQATSVPPNHIYCHGCGTAIHQHAASCPKCGAPQRTEAAVEGGKEKVIAAVLAFFLGGFGAHKFYLGSPIQGLFYLVFCWTFIPACIALIEGIYYLTMTDRDFKSKYR